MSPQNHNDHDLLIRIDERTGRIATTLGEISQTIRTNHGEFVDCKTHRGREIGKLYTEVEVLKEQPNSTRRMIIIGCTVFAVLIAAATFIISITQGV